MDLGIGSGLVEEQLFACRPDASVVGIDSSQAMIDLARARLAPFEQQVRIIQHDLIHFQDALSPAETYALIFSIQAFHHLPHQVQQTLFHAIFDALPAIGVVLLLDRIDLDLESFSDLYRTVWNRLEQVSQIKSGWSGNDFLQKLQKKEDHPVSLENHLSWLREAGFAATCLHLHLNRAL
ncbi:MAG TPA: class I SAM-dependent methyltransferase [Ktedonobacteraceae bacterium]|nr:class I SAM-dependent methyltransferase [Ktedonobacteraceae bacterium]